MPNLIASVAVIDGSAPSLWTVFENKQFGQFLKELGDISVVSETYLNRQIIDVKVLLDDVAKWNGANVRAVTGLIIDGLHYEISAQNPIKDKLEYVLGLLRDDPAAYYRHFGLRIWLMRPTHYQLHSQEIVKTTVAILQIDVAKINIQGVKGFDSAKSELEGLADDLLAKIVICPGRPPS